MGDESWNGKLANCPVRKGQLVDLVISKLGDKGDGIAFIGKYIIIVPGTQVGEKWKVQITKVLDKCAFGKVI